MPEIKLSRDRQTVITTFETTPGTCEDLLDALYFHALTYVHGHSAGGTNPSLLRAILRG